ncbi:MAG: tetratricopeptide repeat protein [Bacteroidetes bacterium]|jgi:tetratricopeptide (TPR) repeat protein|nr:tetratricopeptide repeat protein [Bacteroidota bacterium]
MNKKSICTFCLLLLFFASCGPSPKDLVLAGDEKKAANDYAGASADYSSAILAKPDLYQAWLNRGECQMQLGKYDLALADFNKAISLKPNIAESHYNKGISLMKLKKYPEALESLTKACAMDTAINGNMALASCYFYAGLNQKAILYFSKSLEETPDSIGLYLGRALAFYQSGDLASCKSDVQTYYKSGGSNPVGYRQIGLAYVKSSLSKVSMDSAIVYLELYKSKVTALDAEAAKALTLSYLTRGRQLMKVDMEIEAMADFSKVIELDPANAESYYQRGKIMVSLGQNADGCIDLQTALKNGNTDAQKLIDIYCGDYL